MKTKAFGKNSGGQEAVLYLLENGKGMEAAVTDYGATLVSLSVPDKDGKKTDVVLGYESAAGYEKGICFFGATVGRNANRIGGAAFELNGVRYALEKNDGDNNLHSGLAFTNTRFWKAFPSGDNQVTFSLMSPAGDQGYPGNVELKVTYTLTEDNGLSIHYEAVPDADTVLNMTNHSYFNMDGHDSGDVLEQTVWIDADMFTKADSASIPTGELVDVTGSPMDFRQEKKIGRDIGADYEALRFGKGYDHNWVLKGQGSFRKVAGMTGARSGIHMEVWTDMPGMQLYTANFVEEEQGKNHAVYKMRHAACFETQYYPDAVNRPEFPSPIVKSGETYDTTTTYRFYL